MFILLFLVIPSLYYILLFLNLNEYLIFKGNFNVETHDLLQNKQKNIQDF